MKSTHMPKQQIHKLYLKSRHFHSKHRMPQFAVVECSLCKHSVLEYEVVEHLTSCLYTTFYERRHNGAIGLTYRNYYLLAFILDLIEDYDHVIQKMPPSFTSIIWPIYGYIYANRIGEGYTNIGIGLDCFSRLVIAHVDMLKCKKINIVRHISAQNFTTHYGSLKLNILFDEQQQTALYN